MSCSSNCLSTLLPIYSGCKQESRPGGISHLILKTCAAAVPDPLVTQPGNVASTDWLTEIQACRMRMSEEGVGNKPKGTVTSKRMSSCKAEEPVSGLKTIQFNTFYRDQSLHDYEFWEDIRQNQGTYEVGWVTCEGLWYFFYPFTIDVDEVIEDNNQGTSHFEATISIISKSILIPKVINGLFDYFKNNQTYDCATDSYVYDGDPITV